MKEHIPLATIEEMQQLKKLLKNYEREFEDKATQYIDNYNVTKNESDRRLYDYYAGRAIGLSETINLIYSKLCTPWKVNTWAEAEQKGEKEQ